MNDLKFAIRRLFKSPGFTAVAVLTLALGIGANTAIFSVVNTVLLRQLPYANPDRLVIVWETLAKQDIRCAFTSYRNYMDWRERNQVFEDMALVSATGGALSVPSGAVRIGGLAASSSFFPLLGIEPLLGRTWTADEDRPGNGRVMVLTYGLWQRQFGGDPQIIGRQVTLDSAPYTVIGVLPASFRPDLVGERYAAAFLQVKRAEYWTSLAAKSDIFNQRGNRSFLSVARLKPGVSLEQAQSAMEVVAGGLNKEHSENQGFGINVAPFRAEVVKNIRAVLWMLLGGVGIILLIVCANLANLLLARAATRQKEMGIRAALGASTGRLVRQTLTESLLLAGIGGLTGVLLASWGVSFARPFLRVHLPLCEGLSINGTVLGFALVVSVAAGLLFGSAPALLTLGSNIQSLLQKGQGRSSARGQRLYQDILVAAQIALTLMLLIGAGLLSRSFASLMQTDLGFNPDNILTFNVGLSGPKFDQPNQRQTFVREALARMETLPGIKSVGVTDGLPFQRATKRFFDMPDNPTDWPASSRLARMELVSSGYFQAMGTRLIQGRFCEHRETGREMVINDTMARRFWPNSDPVGKHVRFSHTSYEIVGIVHDFKQETVEAAAYPEMMIPYTAMQGSIPAVMTFTAVTAIEPNSLAGAIRKSIASLDPNVPVFDVRTMKSRISDSFAQRLASVLMVGTFSLLALLLASLGVYGVMACTVSARRQEIGVRMALGAQRSNVMALVFKRGLALAGIGGIAGMVGALGLCHLIRSLLYRTQPADPAAFTAGPLILLTVALLACWLPARRAAKVNPMEALRSE